MESNVVKIYGKKQLDIREDNKSAVINVLLQQESTLPQIAEKLGLSLTALAKVMKELQQKEVVRIVKEETVAYGRPPRVYGINGDCAIACAAVITEQTVVVYYVDMRGFQINETSFANDFGSLPDLINCVVKKLKDMKKHPRLQGNALKYLYVGIPSVGLFGAGFCENRLAIEECAAAGDRGVKGIVRRNVDLEMIAEQEYGFLKRGAGIALINLDDCADIALKLGGKLYYGLEDGHGVWPGYDGFERLCESYGAETGGDFFADYVSNRTEAERFAENVFFPIFGELGKVFFFLGVEEVRISGAAKRLGEAFLSLARRAFKKDFRVGYTRLGKDVPAALSGAVWLSTYSTLQDKMAR